MGFSNEKRCEKCGSLDVIEYFNVAAFRCLTCGNVQGEREFSKSSADVTESMQEVTKEFKKAEGVTRVRCMLEIVAGVIPDQPMPELTKKYFINEADMDNPPRYIEICGMAMNYAMSMQNPNQVNWVRFDWIWL